MATVSRTVKAAVFEGPGTELEIRELQLQEPQSGEVEIKVEAAGVCHSDLHVVNGDWDVPVPLVLGHEGAGVVTALGAGVKDLQIGDHVVVSWVPSCGECRQCLAQRPWQCERSADVIAGQGLLFDGSSRWRDGERALHHYLGASTFAERIVVPESGAIRIRADAPLDVAAIVGCAVATGVGAVQNTAGVQPGSTVAVIGCGGVGLSCIQGARIAGAQRIVAVDVNPAKLTVAVEVGATDSVLVGDDPVAQLRELVPEGLDYVFDAIGRTSTTEQAIRALGAGGAAVIVGLPPTGSSARFDPLVLAEFNQKILGSNYGSVDAQQDIPRLVDLYMEGQLNLEALISGRRPLDEAAAALDDLAAGRTLRTLLTM